MAQRNRKSSRHLSRPKREAGLGPVLVGGIFFALLMVALIYAVQKTGGGQPTDRGTPVAQADTASPFVAQHAQGIEAAASSVKPDSAALAAQDDVRELTASVTADDHAAPDVANDSDDGGKSEATPDQRLEKVKVQVAAGEFGPALETAESTVDAPERTRLLKLVADAQMQVGDFETALATIRRMPVPKERAQVRGDRAVRQSFAGGSLADFTQLIDLIQSVTDGWEETGEGSGTIEQFDTGVRVDPHGMLYKLTREELSGRLEALGVRARTADLNEDMARPSSLRLVSLTRLERAAADRLAEGKPIVSTMEHLAGLTQVRFIFVYPEQGEIVIGGPAEGWRYSEQGIPVGASSGRPTLQLDDFVTVARNFSPSGDNFFNCLIVPRQEGLKKVHDFVAQSNARGPLRAAAVESWVRRLQHLLGLQDIVINGIPRESRVARVIAEADYRMKLIGVDKLDAGPDIPSFFDLLPLNLQQNPPPLSALRWWLTMKYEAVLHSPDHNVFEIQGASVLCQSENEFITSQGERVHTGQAEATNRLFAENFTRHYEELARQDLVFADLQNIFDLSLVAALIQHERLAERVQWDRGVFAVGGAYRPAVFDPPQTVMSVVNHRVYHGKDVVVQVAGGVRADLMSVVTDNHVLRPVARLANLADRGRVPKLPEGRWWWDADAGN